MEKIIYLLFVAILFIGCAVPPEQSVSQVVDKPEKPQPEIILQDELLNEPPEVPLFMIAQPSSPDVAEQTMADAIRQQLVRLGFVEAKSREDANVVVWYSHESEQIGMRHVGQARDVWGDQTAPVVISDIGNIEPIAFKVQIVSLQESRFPHEVIPIWKAEWSSTMPGLNMVEFSRQTLAKVFALYASEETQSQVAAFRKAHERKVKRAINTYMKMVMYRIQKNWQKPTRNVKGKTCKVKIYQSAVGEITSHELIDCDRNRRFRKSIERAIKASSPLPLPQEHLFDRSELILVFQG